MEKCYVWQWKSNQPVYSADANLLQKGQADLSGHAHVGELDCKSLAN